MNVLISSIIRNEAKYIKTLSSHFGDKIFHRT